MSLARRDPASRQPIRIHSSFGLLPQVVVDVGRVEQQADIFAIRVVEGDAAEGAERRVQHVVRTSGRRRHDQGKVFLKDEVKLRSFVEFDISR